ncbi:MAG: hypothetical protein L0332_15435 [Chloroflexi bacterium]|nr:hypothetical protein [Chloroflexota bacterium]MCI0580671.1 hypothetical protein [Chloroflexota bacterium]MCI0648687.1 hypothetical protein [Chloroflexota bacterium]MCI0728095.1 hypothetical protein [Chloroflexota bacterium]
MRSGAVLLLAALLVACASPETEPAAQPTVAPLTETAEPTATPEPTSTRPDTATPDLVSPTAPPVTDTPVSTEPTAPPEEVTPDVTGLLPEGAVIFFSQEGGFAGIMESWTIYADGRVVKSTGDTWQVTPQAVSDLQMTIERTGFFDLPATTRPANICCDFFTYSLAVTYNGQTNVVVMSDGDPNMPQAMRDAVTAVQLFIRDLQAESYK